MFKCVVLGTNLYVICHSGGILRCGVENAFFLHIKGLSCKVRLVSQNKECAFILYIILMEFFHFSNT